MSTGAWLILMLGAGFLGGMVALIADTQYIFRKNGVWDRAYESGKASAMSLMKLELQLAYQEGRVAALKDLTAELEKVNNAGK